MAHTRSHDCDAAPPTDGSVPSLTLFVEEGCRACAHALEVLEQVRREFAGLRVSSIDLGSVSSDEVPPGVFAAPTFVLDGEVISLGTPTWERLSPLLRRALNWGDEG
jgi:hypothetical protein